MEYDYKIEINSTFDELWRYNLVLMGGGYNAKGEKISFAAEKNEIAPTGANLTAKPEQAQIKNKLAITLPQCDNIAIYAYLIPHTLPTNREVEMTLPFDLTITVWQDKERIYRQNH